MRISDWSSDVFSSDLRLAIKRVGQHRGDTVRPGIRKREEMAHQFLTKLVLERGTDGRRPLVGGQARPPSNPSTRFAALGRASGRERGCEYGEILGVARTITKKTRKQTH